MTVLAGMLPDISRAATGSLLAAVWQGMLLAAVVWLGLRLLPKTPAAVRFAIWFGVFVVVTALPLIPLWPHTAAAQTAGHGPWLTLDARWSVLLAAAWGLASVWRAGQLVVAGFRVRALWKRATPIAHPPQAYATLMDGAPARGRRAPLCTSDEVDRPTVIGFFAPKILIPAWLLEKLTPTELDQIVLHESGHLRRADDWMNLLQKLALVLFPLNPALAWVERRLCFERELACDERVLRETNAPKAYAACLTTLAEHRLGRRGLALAIGVLGRESELGQRVGRILRRGAQMKPWQAKLVLSGAMLGLFVAATGLERCPQLVGFSSGQPGQVATNREQGPAVPTVAGFAYQPVMLRNITPQAQEWKPLGDGVSVEGKQPEIKSIARDANVKHQEMSPVPQAVNVSAKDPHASAPAARMVRTSAPGGQQSRSRESQTGDVVITQWTMTAWHDADGSRMVLTTTQVSNRAPRIEQDSDIQAPSQQDLHPYAAVPVRGGWLVFQL